MEGMDFNAFKNSVDHVWIFRGKFLGFFEGGGLNDDETAGLIGKRSSQQHPPLAIERLKVGKVCGAVNFPLGLALRAVEAENHEFHHESIVSFRCGCFI